MNSETYHVVKELSISHDFGGRAAYVISQTAYISFKNRLLMILDCLSFKETLVVRTGHDVVRKMVGIQGNKHLIMTIGSDIWIMEVEGEKQNHVSYKGKL